MNVCNLSKSFLRILLGNLSIITIGLLFSSFLVFRGLDCFVAMLPERSAYFNPFMIASSELRYAISDPLSILVFISAILPTLNIPIISVIRIPLFACFWLLNILLILHFEKVTEQILSCIFFSLEMLLVSQVLLGASNGPIMLFLNIVVPVLICLGANLLFVSMRNEGYELKARTPRLLGLASCFLLLVAAVLAVGSYGEIGSGIMLYFVWFLLILLPGVSIWRTIKKLSDISSHQFGIDIYMSFVLGTIYVALTSWILLELEFFGFWQLAAFQTPLWFLLGFGAVKRSMLGTNDNRARANRGISRDSLLQVILICLFLAILSWATGWFSVGWNTIPWNDAWIFWGRGYHAASTGKLFQSWLFSTSGSGVTPPISGLFASVFLISPSSKIASILFMKAFSLVLVFFSAMGVYCVSRILISTFWKDASAICSSFASLAYLSSSWTIMYTYYFVRELLGTTVFLSVLILSFQEMSKLGKPRLLHLTLLSLLGNLLYYISPLTWFYFLPIFIAFLTSNTFNSALAGKSRAEIFIVMCAPLLPIVYERLIWLPATTGYLSAQILSSVQPPWNWGLAYMIVNSSGSLFYLLSLLGILVLLLTVYRLKESRARAFVAITFPAIILLLSIVLPFSKISLNFRYAYILSIAEGLAVSAFLAWLMMRMKKMKVRDIYQKLWPVIISLLIVSQISYGLMHSTLIDKRSDSEVIAMLQSLDQRLPANYTVVVDSFDDEQMLYKATGLLSPRDVVDWSIFREYDAIVTNKTQLEGFIGLLKDKNIGFLWVNTTKSSLSGYIKPLLDNQGVMPYSAKLSLVGEPVFLNAESTRYEVYFLEVTS